jgi:serine/threonine protein kinase
MTLLLPFSCAALPKSCSYYALKILKKSEVIYLKQVEHVKTEKKLLETISHPFVVNLMGAFQDEKNLYLMMVRKRAGQQPSPNLSLWPALRARACETRGGSSGRSTETLRMPLPRRRPLRAWCLYARARTLPIQTRARLHPFLTPLLLLLPPPFPPLLFLLPLTPTFSQEYIIGGEFFSHLRKAGRFPNDTSKFYAAQITVRKPGLSIPQPLLACRIALPPCPCLRCCC